jgi:hypothetical protein
MLTAVPFSVRSFIEHAAFCTICSLYPYVLPTVPFQVCSFFQPCSFLNQLFLPSIQAPQLYNCQKVPSSNHAAFCTLCSQLYRFKYAPSSSHASFCTICSFLHPCSQPYHGPFLFLHPTMLSFVPLVPSSNHASIQGAIFLDQV